MSTLLPIDPDLLSEPLKQLSKLDTSQIAQLLDTLSDGEIESIATDWSIWARPNQLLPSIADDWRAWLVKPGRGWGKTRTGASAVHEVARRKDWLDGGDIVIGGRTYGEVHKIMVDGPSGIMASAPSDFRPRWFPGKDQGLLRWPNGVRGICLTGDKPAPWRGPNAGFAWCDELAHWDRARDCWDNLQFALRLGIARVIVTTTPTPDPLIIEIRDDPTTIVTDGSTWDNRRNLAAAYIAHIDRTYSGTRLGRQEIDGEILLDAPGALWRREQLETDRVPRAPDLVRLAIAIDPSVTDPSKHPDPSKLAEVGIMVGGIDRHGQGYLLEDLSGLFSPDQWATIVTLAYQRIGADVTIGEVNNGGDLVETVLRATGIPVAFKAVRASRGKMIRAEPVATLCERHRIHHVGAFPKLEDQLCLWEPGKPSPDRLDAYVWLWTELLLQDEPDKEPGPITAYL